MQWFSDACSIFKIEDETYMSYWRGQHLDKLPHVKNKKPIVEGLPLQVFLFVYRLFRNYRPFGDVPKERHIDFLFFAGSQNQMVALQTSLIELKERKIRTCAIGERFVVKIEKCSGYYEPLSYSLADIGKALFLLIVRGPDLWLKLRREYDALTRRRFFVDFCRSYIYVPYFLKVLKRSEPKFIVVANDHNVANRSLIAVAHYLKIRTVYLQHASVGNLFPALRFDYAFLDGMASLDIYEKCRDNRKATQLGYPLPKIFLSGQKKPIRKEPSSHAANGIGVAINILDDIDDTIRLVKVIVNAGLKVSIRWHPMQDSVSVAKIRKAFFDNKNITLSDPASNSLQDFFSACFVLVAGNTSIHLEAIVVGVPTVYYQISPVLVPDVYGYVANGLADCVESTSELITYLKSITDTGFSADKFSAVRYYSSSFGTEWEGREGILVAETLERISKYQPVTDLYVEKDKVPEFDQIYAIA